MGKKLSKLPPDKIKEYTACTLFKEDELTLWYKFFMKDCPSGSMSCDEFVSIYRVFYPDGRPDQFASHVFRAFDSNKDGKLDFDDFVKALSKTAKGTTLDKLEWVFKLYDVDGDNRISRQDMGDVVNSIYLMAGKDYSSDDYRQKECKERVDFIFQRMDEDHDNFLSFEEFKEGAQYDSNILRSLEWEVAIPTTSK